MRKLKRLHDKEIPGLKTVWLGTQMCFTFLTTLYELQSLINFIRNSRRCDKNFHIIKCNIIGGSKNFRIATWNNFWNELKENFCACVSLYVCI